MCLRRIVLLWRICTCWPYPAGVQHTDEPSRQLLDKCAVMPCDKRWVLRQPQRGALWIAWPPFLFWLRYLGRPDSNSGSQHVSRCEVTWLSGISVPLRNMSHRLSYAAHPSSLIPCTPGAVNFGGVSHKWNFVRWNSCFLSETLLSMYI